MSLEHLLDEYNQVRKQMGELEEKKKELKEKILGAMTESKMEVGRYKLRSFSQIYIKISMDAARKLDAVVMKEAVDREKIRTLYQLGEKIEGVREVPFLTVTIKKEEIALC